MLGLVLPLFSLLTLSLGREIPLSTPAIEPAVFPNEAPRVASNGDNFLVVWTQGRHLGDDAAYATRVDRDGNVLDAEALRLGDSFGRVSVASDGRDYVVAWQCASAGFVPRTCLARVDAATGAATPGAMIEGGNPAIASDGSGYVVIAKRGTTLNSSTITAVPIGADGAMEGEPFPVASSPYLPEVASNGRDYLVVWSSHTYLDAVLISNSAVIGAPQRFTTFAPANGPGPFGWSVASDGDAFLVAWQQNRRLVSGVYQTDLRVSRVSRDGVAGELHTVVGAQAWQPALTWIGSRYLLTWTYGASPIQGPYYAFSEDGDIRGLTVDDSGVASSSMIFADRSGRESGSASASNGADTLVVWENRHRHEAVQIEGRFLGSDTRFVISTGAPRQESVASSRRHEHPVFAWSENRGEEQVRTIRLQRLDSTRTPLDGRGIAVAPSDRHQLRPAIAGSLVVWVEQDLLPTPTNTTRIRAKMLDATGAPFGQPIEVGIAAFYSTVAVAAAGSKHLVVWESPDGRIVGAHIDPIARPHETPLPFEVSPGPLDNAPAVASDGSHFLVTWQRDRFDGIVCIPGCTPQRSIHAAVVTAWGVVGGAPVEIAAKDDVEVAPTPLWNGTEYAILWTKWGVESPLRVRYVQRGGIPFGAEQFVVMRDSPIAFAWTGSEYLVATHGRTPLTVMRVSRDLRVLQKMTIPSAVPGSGVALMDGYVAYSTGVSSRLKARAIASDLPARRRRVR